MKAKHLLLLLLLASCKPMKQTPPITVGEGMEHIVIEQSRYLSDTTGFYLTDTLKQK